MDLDIECMYKLDQNDKLKVAFLPAQLNFVLRLVACVKKCGIQVALGPRAIFSIK